MLLRNGTCPATKKLAIVIQTIRGIVRELCDTCKVVQDHVARTQRDTRVAFPSSDERHRQQRVSAHVQKSVIGKDVLYADQVAPDLFSDELTPAVPI
jgi:hypothetical protein